MIISESAQELWPSGDNGSAVTMGDYLRDVFLEQVLPPDKSCYCWICLFGADDNNLVAGCMLL